MEGFSTIAPLIFPYHSNFCINKTHKTVSDFSVVFQLVRKNRLPFSESRPFIIHAFCEKYIFEFAIGLEVYRITFVYCCSCISFYNYF